MLSGDPDKFGESLATVASVCCFGCILEKQTTAFSTTASTEDKLILPVTCNLEKKKYQPCLNYLFSWMYFQEHTFLILESQSHILGIIL